MSNQISEFKKFDLNGNPTCFIVQCDGNLAVGLEDGNIEVWNVFDGISDLVYKGHTKKINCLTCLYDFLLASGSSDNTIRIWEPSSGNSVRTLEGHSQEITSLTTLSDGNLASGSADNSIIIWEVSTGKNLKVLKGHESSINYIALLADGNIASGHQDGTVLIWDLSSGEKQFSLSNIETDNSCFMSLPTNYLAIPSSESEGEIILFDNSEGQTLNATTHKSTIVCFASLSDGSLVSGSKDKEIGIRNILKPGDSELKVLIGHTDTVNTIIKLFNGNLASGSMDKTIRIWDVPNGSCINVIATGNVVDKLLILPDGSFLSISGNKTIQVFGY